MADEPGYPSDGGRQAPDFLTVDQTADVLQLGRSTTYELVGRFVRSAGTDGIPAILVGGQYRIPRARLEEYAGRAITWPPPPRPRKARPHRRSRKAADTAPERAQLAEGGRHGHPEAPAPASERAAEAVIHIGAHQLPGTPADDLAPDRDDGCDAGSGDDCERPTELTHPNLGRNSLDHLPGLKEAIPAREIDGIYTYAATCVQLEAILSQPLTNCPDGQPFDLQFAGQFDGAADTTVPVVEYESVPGESYSFAGRVVPPHTVDMSSARHWDVRIDPTSRTEFIAELMRADPTARLQIWSGGNELATMVLALVVAGAIAAFVLGFGAVIVATADRALDRRKLDALQLATGVPTKLLRRVQFLTVAIPTTLTVTLAAALGTVTGHLYRITGNEDDLAFPWPAALSTTAAGLIGVALSATLAYLLAQTRVDPADLRSE